MDKLRTVFSPQEDEQGILSSVESSFNLSWSTRIKGFIFCFVIGILLSLLGAMFLWVPVKGLILFALFYTLGNVFSIGSTVFLMGPANQCKRMFQETRIFAAVFMFVSTSRNCFDFPFSLSRLRGIRFRIFRLQGMQSKSAVQHSLSDGYFGAVYGPGRSGTTCIVFYSLMKSFMD
ncbi:hypothetical protein EG68_00239 [Paragonimus skrjabini miyazakii]|uniref:Vesicle transport protein n=1 Tax=Paragonimus skrjabini miyazakii TaxID=59628 RepID=A0A8S9Z6E6_9TREM|nr:hypothetical protein EG68_00239 [Paragonimus skrjabini miyazakii]